MSQCLRACVVCTVVLSPPPLHDISHLDITHLHLLLGLLAVVVDGEHPQTPGLGRVVPHTSLPAGRVTVGSYHRLGRVGRLEIIGHRPVVMSEGSEG